MLNTIKNFFNNLFDKNEYSLFFRVCYLLIGSLFFPIFIASLLFIFNIGVNLIEYGVGIIILFISYFYFFYNKKNKLSFYIPIIIAIALFAVSIGTTYVIYDNTGDGFAYHLPAVIKLSHGWNPLYEHFDNDSIISIWSEHYPKSIWIYGAFLYQMTNHVFSPTAFNFIIAFGSCFILYDIIYRITKLHVLSFLSGVIISFNIILLGQLYTMYNDGVLGLCIITAMLLYISSIKKTYTINKVLNPMNIMLVSYLSILANIKFTGALFAFIIFVVYTIIMYAKKIFKLDKAFLAYIIIIGLGVVVISLNTYLPNFIHHHNIGYPIVGKDKIDIINLFIPEYINDSNGKIASFVKSITLDSSENKYAYNPPYIINIDDLYCISGADCRQQGFGPFYQIIFIMTGIIFIIFIVNFVLSKENIKKKLVYILGNYHVELISLVVLFAFFMITPATWWSRYIPFIYPIPLLIILLSNIDYKKLNIITYLSVTIVIVYLISSIVGFNFATRNKLNFTKIFKKELAIIENAKDKDLIYINKDNVKVYVLEEMTGRKILKNGSSDCAIDQEYKIISVGILKCDKESENDSNKKSDKDYGKKSKKNLNK